MFGKSLWLHVWQVGECRCVAAAQRGAGDGPKSEFRNRGMRRHPPNSSMEEGTLSTRPWRGLATSAHLATHALRQSCFSRAAVKTA
eukprot:1155364-Pleurochrysis_carterae.AAC.1